jgi:hypothetical protein
VAPGLSLKVLRATKLCSLGILSIILDDIIFLILHFTDESSTNLCEEGTLHICAMLKKRCDTAVSDTFFRRDIVKLL